MTIYERLKGAIETTGIPAYRDQWRATEGDQVVPKAYAIYSRTTGEYPLSADNEPRTSVEYGRVNIYSATDPSEAFEGIRAALAAAGFAIRQWGDLSTIEPEGYHIYISVVYNAEMN
jgi:hypothetical protein